MADVYVHVEPHDVQEHGFGHEDGRVKSEDALGWELKSSTIVGGRIAPSGVAL